MAMYCLNMLAIALELAKSNPLYEDIASKFLEHFLYIADTMNHISSSDVQLWDEVDNFYYDVLHLAHNERLHLKVRSMVGLIPVFAVETIDQETLDAFLSFNRRFECFIKNRLHLTKNIACMEAGTSEIRLLAIMSQDKLRQILQKLLNEAEFLSFCGIRSVSKFYAENPYLFEVDGQQHRVDYEPAGYYFHNDNGAGLGANHQTGWTDLVAQLIHQYLLNYSSKFEETVLTNRKKLVNC